MTIQIRGTEFEGLTEETQSQHDPAMLLHASVTNDISDASNDLQNLVAAATNAAAQEQSQDRQHLEELDDSSYLVPDSPAVQNPQSSTVDTLQIDNEIANISPRPTKRQKQSHGSVTYSSEPVPNVSTANSQSLPYMEAGASNPSSAAALFRAPTQKKSTRPAMSEMFNSLQLPAENFLKLQAAAKDYMLDAEHPERRDCVGNRGKTDTAQTRLDLQKCVRTFLDRAHGEEFFGVDAAQSEDGERREAVWPADREVIVKLCTPLLRRVVTNERQRRYAVDTRRGAKVTQVLESGLENASPAGDKQQIDRSRPSNYDGPSIQIYVYDKSGQLARNRLDLPLHDSIGWDYVYDVIHAQTDAAAGEEKIHDMEKTEDLFLEIRVLTPRGLEQCTDATQWQSAVKDVKETAWLENLVKIIVNTTSST